MVFLNLPGATKYISSYGINFKWEENAIWLFGSFLPFVTPFLPDVGLVVASDPV